MLASSGDFVHAKTGPTSGPCHTRFASIRVLKLLLYRGRFEISGVKRLFSRISQRQPDTGKCPRHTGTRARADVAKIVTTGSMGGMAKPAVAPGVGETLGRIGPDAAAALPLLRTLAGRNSTLDPPNARHAAEAAQRAIGKIVGDSETKDEGHGTKDED